MTRPIAPRRVHPVLRSRLRSKAQTHRPIFELLEDRTMLSGLTEQLPPSIVLGRTQATPITMSSPTATPVYFVGEVPASNQVVLTYTAYNEQADPVTGVLLTTTLEPGVTFVSSSVTLGDATTTQLPDQSGQKLAWSFGTIPGNDRESVAVTVSVTTPIPLQLDTGASAYAMLDAGIVSASTPAATLQLGNVSDPSLLASTVDADTNDPFIQEEAAALDYNAQNIFNFLHTQIAYNSYLGSVRGARGTLWSLAGNSLDTASLGVALMRASGIPAQYASGTLSQSDAQELILSMFPAQYQTVGYIPAGTPVSDPADDPQLLSETESHYWFQFDTGSGMQDADPRMVGATIGQTFTTATGTFAAVPADLEETTEVQLVAEIYSQADADFGLSPFQDTTVLDQTFDDVALVGRPLTIGNTVSSSSSSALAFTSTTNTYSPYIDVGDDAYDATQDQVIQGQSYQEVLTNFPFGSQVLTGLILDVTLSGPQGSAQTFSRYLADRLGPAARAGLQAPSLSIPPGAPPLLSNFDVYTLDISAAANDPMPMAELSQEIQTSAAQVTALQASQDTVLASAPFVQNLNVALTRELDYDFHGLSDLHTQAIASAAGVVAYYARPRVVMIADQITTDPTTLASSMAASIDILNDSMRVEGYPGQSTFASFAFSVTRGVFENIVEGNVVALLAPTGQAPSVDDTTDVFEAAASQGIGLAVITTDNLATLGSLDISDDAKALITSDVEAGMVVIVPDQAVTINDVPTIAWAEVNSQTDEYIGVDSNGGHQGLDEFLALEFAAFHSEVTLLTTFGTPLVAFDSGAVLSVSYELNTLTGSTAQAKAMLMKDKETVDTLFFNVELGLLVTGIAAEAAIVKVLGELSAAAIGGTALEAATLASMTFKNTLYYVVNRLTGEDPPLGPILSNPQGLAALPAYQTQSMSEVSNALIPGGAQVALKTSGATVSGQLGASWSSSTSGSFQATAVTASAGTILSANGQAVGSGEVTLASDRVVPLGVSGTVQYAVSGSGSLSFFGPAESSLGVSGDWQNYTATVTGNVSITLTVLAGALTLNGQALPAGTYTITTNSATLTGSGASSSPNFAGSVSINATGSTINLGPGTGTLSVVGTPLNVDDETTLDGYTGTISVSANGDGTDSVNLSGKAGNVLQATTSPATLTTDQNTSITFATKVETSLADTYNLTANAPAGWTVSIDNSGNVTATPAPGLQSGTFPIQIIVESQTDANLVAQTTVEVTITPTQPGITFAVNPDPIFTVPFNGAQLPTAFRATIQNLGPAKDTYVVTFSNVPTGFTILNSATSVTVPAGDTGILGIYLEPNAGQPIPPVGTQLSFTVTATSTNDSSITQTVTETFTVPAIDSVSLSGGPTSLSSSPGVAASTTLTLQNDGNVSETVALSAATPTGVASSGLSTVTIAAGATQTETLTLTPATSVALNQTLATTITATYGPTATPLTTTDEVDLLVTSPQTAAVSQAATAAGSANNTQLASVLSDFGNTLSSLQSATSGPLFTEAQNDLANLSKLLTADPALASFVTQLQPIITAANAGNLAGMLSPAQALFQSIAGILSVEAAEQFTASLSPNEVDLTPGQGQTFNLTLTSESNDPISLTVGVGTLPSNVTVDPGQSQVTLAPNQTLSIPMTLTQSIQSTKVFTLLVTAAASMVSNTSTAVVAITPAAADVLSVSATPATVNPGDPLAVTAQIFNTANAARNVLVHIDILDTSGNVVSSPPDQLVSLATGAGNLTVNLGQVPTTGLANGLYSLRVSLLTSDGFSLPGHSSQIDFEVGQAVTASVVASTAIVPPGTSTVTTTISVANNGSTAPSTPTVTSFDNIQVFYASNESQNIFGVGNVDGAIFAIEDASTQPITDGVLTINPVGGPSDSFNVGTVPAGSFVLVKPGISNDGGTNHTFFKVTGTLLDESEDGPNSDNTQFEFTGTQGGVAIDSGIFTPAATKGPSNDGKVTSVNFLGGPGDADQSSNDVFGPKVVATFTPEAAGSTPPSSPISVEVGYADDLRRNPFFPSPWKGSPNTVFVGEDSSNNEDSGTIRIINNESVPITVNDVSVTMANGAHYDLWGSNVLAPGESLLLSQTNGQNFDSSDSDVTLPYPQTYPDGETLHAAKINITVNGVLLPTFLDTF